MELKKDFRRLVTIELIADDEKLYDEITPFISAFEKIYEDSKKIGFQNRFSKNEQMVLKGIWENIKDNDALTGLKKTDQKVGEGK